MVEQFKSSYFYNFNQDFSYFIYGALNSFKVYRTIPYTEIAVASIDESYDIIKAELSYRSNIVAILAQNKFKKSYCIYLYDFSLKKIMIEINDLKDKVLNIKIRKDLFIIHETSNVYIYKFPNIELIDSLPAYYNPVGIYNNILSMNNYDDTPPIIAFKSKKNSVTISIDCFGSHVKKALEKSHNEEICCMCLSPEGNVLASSSINVNREFNKGKIYKDLFN